VAADTGHKPPKVAAILDPHDVSREADVGALAPHKLEAHEMMTEVPVRPPNCRNVSVAEQADSRREKW